MKFSFSMASDIRVNPNILYIFGGREVIDGKSATLARPPASNPNYASKNTFILNLLGMYYIILLNVIIES